MEVNAPAAAPRRTWRARLFRWAVGLSGFYVVVVALLLALEDRFLYPAASADDSWSPPGKLHVLDVELDSDDGTRLHAWWCPVEGADNVLLLCHGNAGNLSHHGPLIERLQRLPASVLIFDYPGYGKSEGRPSEAGCYAAADAAYDWLVEVQKVPPQRIVLAGVSLGGGVATDLAVRRRHRALVLCMTFTSAPDAARHAFPFVPTGWLMRNRFDNLAKIGRARQGVFITHGVDDQGIPPSQSERLYAVAPEPKRYVPMKGVGHGWPIFTDDCLNELRDFLRQLPEAE
jgi:fermentation-respiration switch protein FrsA (DUF1100 family)